MGDDLTAAELVRRGLCNAACLITTGRESTGCACACAGRWHGALADATVPDTADATPTPQVPAQAGPDLLDVLALTATA